jgi:RND family efflux transporter MFP subunit
MSPLAKIQRWSTRPPVLIAGTAIVALLLFLRVGSSAGADANVETAEAVIGDFVDSLTFRGDIKATQSALVTAPTGAGELQIVKLARPAVPVSRGDIVVQFDGTQVMRTLQEKRTALRQAEAEIEKARAQAKIDQEATRTEQMKGTYDVERAKLDVGTREVVSSYDAAKAELSLSDAQQRVKEVDARLGASQASQRAEMQGLLYKRDKAAADVALAEKQSRALVVKAPVSGPFMVQNVWRGPGMESEYREGDRAWSGAIIAEIPDPSKIYLAARVDEADRGRLKPGMTARVTSDSLPGVEFAAKLVAFSTLARPDYSTWPPPRNFDVNIEFDKEDERIRPGMSATIRVAVDRLEGALLVPTRAVIQTDGQPIVYVATSGGFEARPVTIARRSQEQVAIASGLKAGERVALRDPTRPDAAAGGSASAPPIPAGGSR